MGCNLVMLNNIGFEKDSSQLPVLKLFAWFIAYISKQYTLLSIDSSIRKILKMRIKWMGRYRFYKLFKNTFGVHSTQQKLTTINPSIANKIVIDKSLQRIIMEWKFSLNGISAEEMLSLEIGSNSFITWNLKHAIRHSEF